MNHLEHYAAQGRRIETCVVGSGGFGRSFLSQAQRSASISGRVAVDRDVETAVAAWRSIGIAAADIAACANASEARAAWAAGRFIAAADLRAVVELPVDVVIEATGHPEAGAHHASIAIDAGRHVALASKEVDSVVGPVLAARAARAGRVVTPVDGDQPSLLMGLVTWAQLQGFSIVAAGKASEYDFVHDAARDTVESNGRTIEAPAFAAHADFGARDPAEVVAARSAACAALPQHAVPDLCEMQLVANATGLVPDVPCFHAPIARITEVATLYGRMEHGGLLHGEGVLDVFHCLRRPEEISFAGGVFVIVRCDDAPTWELLAGKGHLLSRDRQRAMLWLPRHLLGLEAATSVLDAALHGRSSGARQPLQRIDLAGRATRRLEAGSLLAMGGHHHSIAGVDGELVPGAALAPAAAAPFYLAANRRLARSVEAGALITCGDLELDGDDSRLLALRREQDHALPWA